MSIILGVGDGTFHAAANHNIGSFSKLPFIPPSSIAVGDFNGDGNVDLAFTAGHLIILLGNGNGGFLTVVDNFVSNPGLLTLGDFNGDGRTDMAITYFSTPGFSTFLGTPVAGSANQNWLISPSTLPGASVGLAYQVQLTVQGGFPPYSNWALASGVLPPGLALAPNTGLISGVPTAGGTYNFTITVKDSVGSQSAPQSFALSLATPLSVTTKSIPNGAVGAAYSASLSATGGTAPYTWAISTGTLPAGLLLNASTGVITGTPTAAGTYNLSATARDSTGQLSMPQPLSTVVGMAATTITLLTSPNPSNYSQNVTLTATVSPSSGTGSVTFKDGSATLGSSILNGGTATLNVTTLSVSSHVLTATYNGDANYTGGTSAAATQKVTPSPTTTTLTASPNPSSYGQRVTLAATVAVSGATGSVAFMEGSTTLGSGSVNGGTASLSLTTLGVGSHVLSAVYSGDVNFVASTALSVTQIVNLAPTTTTLISSANSSPFGQNVTLTATVAPASATGSVTFNDGSTTLGSSAITGGTAALSLSTLVVGSHAVTAVYSGDANYAASSSTATKVTISGPSSVTLTSSANPSAPSQNVTLTATVSPSPATGSVTFRDGALTLGSGTVSGGTATLTLMTLSSGSHALTAAYNGDTTFQPSTSPVLTQAVNGISSDSACSPTFSFTTGQSVPSPSTCGFTAIIPAAFSISTTATWLLVTPSTGMLGPSRTPFSISVNPSGLSPGTYPANFTISGPQLGSITALAELKVAAGAAPTLFATPTALTFDYLIGSLAPPTQSLTISSTNSTQLPFTVTPNGGSWLIPLATSGISPVQLSVSVSPVGVPPSIQTGTLTISSPGVPPIVISVTLKVTMPVPPQLSVNTTSLSLSGLQGAAAPSSEQIQVSNVGGGVLNFTATASGGDWLSLSQTSGVIDNSALGGASSAGSTPGSSVALTIQGDPSSLNPGTYLGSVTIAGAETTVTIPVTFSVASPLPRILVSQTGLSFTAASQGGAPLPQQIGILNVGNGTLNWSATASTLSGGDWLQISNPSGTVQQPYLDVSTAGVTIDPAVVAGLASGDYYGQIQIAGQALNSPQLVTVILTVLDPGTDPGPEVRPSSLIFTGLAGISPDPQSVMIGIRKAVADQYLSSHIGVGYTYTPEKASVQPDQPTAIQVIPDFSTLTPGEIDRGTITLQFSDGTVRAISLLTVLAPAPSGNSRLGSQATNNCANLNLQWREPSPSPPNFSVVQAHGQTLELQVVDNCGNLVGPGNPKSAAVQATFSNKDSDLSLVHVGNGVWTGTWKPVNSSSKPVTVSVTAFNSTGQVVQSGQSIPLFGTILPGNTPLVTSGGVQQAASFVLGAPIAPGTLITLQGLNLADRDSATVDEPLPTLWNGTQVFLGTEPLPLLYTASGQVNVQVPYDVPVNTQFQVTVQRDNVQSLPEQLVIAEAQPGIFTVDASGAGQGVIYRSDGATYAQPGTPATAGEVVTIQCAGLGKVTPEVAAGTPPPDSPLSSTVNAVAVTIGGVNAQATVGTLVPGRPGVYQVSATVPDGVSGDAVPVVVTVAGQASPAVVTMAVQ